MPNLITISPDRFSLFFKISHFFYHFFFVLVNMGPYGRENFKWHLLWNYITDSLQKKPVHTSKEGLQQVCINFKIGEISNFGFCQFVFVFVNIGPYNMRDKTSNDILSENTQQICSQKFMHTPRKGLYQSCIKNCEISNFGFLAFFFFVLFLGRLKWESIGNYKMCDVLETSGRRAKRTKICTSGVSI